MDAGERPLPRWAEVGSVVVAGVAIVLGIVLRLAPEDEPFDTVRFVFLLVGLAVSLTASVTYLVAVIRGKLRVAMIPNARSRPRRDVRRLSRAAVGPLQVSDHEGPIVRVAARRLVDQSALQVTAFVGFTVLSASNLAQVSGDRDDWRWVFAASSAMFLGFLVMTLWQYHGALRVLARSEPAPADEVR
ncbi:hypothetical protein [Curtobacterium sp. B8]|uniref:hypothetical protein n=1 Tax=Curtobacterium sp. B8 TaxID=95611 RepID=UPI0011D29DA4|nr:hypothetical protein [Curtobacterium sp. B8]